MSRIACTPSLPEVSSTMSVVSFYLEYTIYSENCLNNMTAGSNSRVLIENYWE